MWICGLGLLLLLECSSRTGSARWFGGWHVFTSLVACFSFVPADLPLKPVQSSPKAHPVFLHGGSPVDPLMPNVCPCPSFCRLSTLLHSSHMSSCSSCWCEVPPWKVLWMALNTTLGDSPISPSWWRQRWEAASAPEVWHTSLVMWACFFLYQMLQILLCILHQQVVV